MQERIPAVFMRGGTSRAICFREDALAPYDQATRERIILAALGSPDPYGRQVDGLGGGISSLSKVAIIGRGADFHSDVTFTFGQVEIQRPFIDWSGTCGNISAAVGPFAVDEGLVSAVEPVTRVRVLATNTGKRFIAHVPVCGGKAEVEGDYSIDGVPAPGARITLEYLDPGGSLGGDLLPTGVPRQRVPLADSSEVTVSIVDVSLPVVYVRAEELGVDATQPAPELDADCALQERLEEIRCRAAVLLGLAGSVEEAQERVRAIPKIALVAPAASYRSSGGRWVESEEMDLLARAVSMGNTHRTYPGTVSICTAVAAAIEGSVVHEVSRAGGAGPLRIGHPAGTVEVGARVKRWGSRWQVQSVTVWRTARRIMEGFVLVPRQYLEGRPWF